MIDYDKYPEKDESVYADDKIITAQDIFKDISKTYYKLGKLLDE